MTLLSIILIDFLIYREVAPGFFDKKEYYQYLPSTPDFPVYEVYKRQCCSFSKAIEQFPIKSDTEAATQWTMIKRWRHYRQKDSSYRPYIMDCYKHIRDPNLYVARIFTESSTILLELKVKNCERLPGVIRIKQTTFNYGDRSWYHDITVNNLKHPREDPSRLRRGNIGLQATGVYYKCIHFLVSEKNDSESECESNVTFYPADWV